MAKYDEWLTEEGLLKIEGWARDGLTDEQIAHNMGISTKTLYNWKNDHLPILQSLKKGKEVVDRLVENALLKRALGYRFTEVTKEGGVVTKEVTKEVHPDTTAQIFWLKNRKSTVWRDKPNDDSKLKRIIEMLKQLGLNQSEIDELMKEFDSSE